MAVLLTCLIAWLPFSNSSCEIPKMNTNYHTLGFFLETEMFHCFKKMFSFINIFLHFQVMPKCPIFKHSFDDNGGFILVKCILNNSHVRMFWISPQEKSRPYVLISPQSAKGNSGERWVSYELAFNHDVNKQNVNCLLCLVFPFFICWLFLADILMWLVCIHALALWPCYF